MARKRRRRGLGDSSVSWETHKRSAQGLASALKRHADTYAHHMQEGSCYAAGDAAEVIQDLARDAMREVQGCNYHIGAGVSGLGDGCRDSRGNFIPVPACMGRHVPGSKRKSCPHGRNKRTGKCLKRPRRK